MRFQTFAVTDLPGNIRKNGKESCRIGPWRRMLCSSQSARRNQTNVSNFLSVSNVCTFFRAELWAKVNLASGLRSSAKMCKKAREYLRWICNYLEPRSRWIFLDIGYRATCLYSIKRDGGCSFVFSDAISQLSLHGEMNYRWIEYRENAVDNRAKADNSKECSSISKKRVSKMENIFRYVRIILKKNGTFSIRSILLCNEKQDGQFCIRLTVHRTRSAIL